MADRNVHVKCSDGVSILNNCLKKHKMDPQHCNQSTNQPSACTKQPIDRIKGFYPNVNESEFPLPRSWSSHDKCNSIGLTQNNLRVHYKGIGKSHNDAASVRTAHPIPAACGLYYFEVKIISKGRDGYMGIGLTAQNFKMNRLPGWDKQSYGYHGDDGNSFCSSGNGQPYGPTFTTGDIIGCGVNLVDSTCFYTKNGHHLGMAFQDLPAKLYPTVGLQTPGEVVDANFGQEPFKYDIEDMMKELRAVTKSSIYDVPLPDNFGDWTHIMHKMVQSYLVHHGYSSTAESFARTTNQDFGEEVTSIKNRQKIVKLVMSGRMGLAIEHTISSYPGLLENNQNLLFMLKCRQFVEMVNGSDVEIYTNRPSVNSVSTQLTSTTLPAATNTISNPVQTSVIQSTKAYTNGTPVQSNGNTSNGVGDAGGGGGGGGGGIGTTTAIINNDNQDLTKPLLSNSNFTPTNNLENITDIESNKNHVIDVQMNNLINTAITTNSSEADRGVQTVGGAGGEDYTSDVEMENNVHITNGNNHKNGSTECNFSNNSIDLDEEMDVDPSPTKKSNKSGVERMLEFGRELFQLSQRLEKENGANEANQKMLEDAFSLLAYSNPWASPLGWQLCPSRRETVCAALNSAILESMNYSWRPPMEISIAHAHELLRLMARSSLGSCAFASIEDILLTESTSSH